MPSPSPRRRRRPAASARHPHGRVVLIAASSPAPCGVVYPAAGSEGVFVSWHGNYGWHPPELPWFSSGLCGWFPVLVALEGSLAGDAEVTADEGPVGSVATESEYVFLLALGEEFA